MTLTLRLENNMLPCVIFLIQYAPHASLTAIENKIIVSYLLKFNTLTANYEYSRSNTDNLPLPVQVQLSEKLKTFYKFFIAFSESALNFEHFEKK